LADRLGSPDGKVGTFTPALYHMKNDWKRIFAFE
jgi:hypothetical protein